MNMLDRTGGPAFRAALVLFSVLLPAVAMASVGVNLLGPVDFARTTGRPDTYTATFPGVDGAATLIVENDRVSSATLVVNGVEVAGPADFSQAVKTLTIPLEIGAANTLGLRLSGKPGASLRITIAQTIRADGASIVGPEGGLIVVHSGPFEGAEMRVPPGSLAAAALIVARAVPDPIDPGNTDSVLELTPHGLTFAVPVFAIIPSERTADGTVQHYSLGAPGWYSLGHDECETGRLCGRLESFSYVRVFHSRLCQWSGGRWNCRDAARTDDPGWPKSFSKYEPVLLIHGIQPFQKTTVVPPLESPLYCGQAGLSTWATLPRLLHDDQGMDVWRFDYDHELGLRLAAASLREAVDSLQALTGRGQTTLVGHSMGGLLARQYLAFEDGAGKVSRLVTLGTPHLGSWWGAAAAVGGMAGVPVGVPVGRSGCLIAGGELVPGSEFLTELNAASPAPLEGPEPQYVFVAGQDRRGLSCEAEADDGIVGLDSALARRPGDVMGDLYPDAATRVTLVGQTHVGLWPLSACGDQGLIDIDTPEHATYQELLKWVRINRDLPLVRGRLFHFNSTSWSSDDTKIYEVKLPSRQSRLVADLAGLGLQYPDQIQVSSDGRRLAFAAGTWQNGEIYVVDVRTSAVRRVTDLPGAPAAAAPRWSANDPGQYS